MKIIGTYTLKGPRERIWPLIYDPASLISLIPGCEKIEQVSPNQYRGQVQVRVPAVSGTYQTYIQIIELDEPRYCCFEGNINGPAGSIEGTASFELVGADQQTIIEYKGHAVITGPLAKLNPRFVEGLAQTLINQGLEKLNKQLDTQTY